MNRQRSNLRNFIGGDLHHSPVYDKILSIGYEFETHDLAKLSLSPDGKTLINTNLNMRTYTEHKKGPNYYKIKFPEKDPRIKFDEFVNIPFPRENITMHVINDLGNSDFMPVLKSLCDKVHVDKNKMYVYKTAASEGADAKTYAIDFVMDNEVLQKNCSIFSGVEWLVTYYKPRQNKKIILETFIDAFLRISNHLQQTVAQNGNLYFIGDGEEQPIGDLTNRGLFHLPETNLYYFQSYDTDEPLSQKGILDTPVVPQMTFRCNIADVCDIAKQIVENVDDIEYNTIKNLEKMVSELIDAYNSNVDDDAEKMPTTSEEGKKIRGYLFLIYYKLYAYVEFFSKSDEDNEDSGYLKNFLTFSARNTNDDYYFLAKEILSEHYDGDEDMARDVLMKVFNQPDIVGKYMYPTRKDKKAFGVELTVNDEDYGDPVKSYISYFKFFEEPSEEAQERHTNDWFHFSNFEFTSSYSTDQDTVLIENRLFVHEIFDFIKKNNIPVRHESNSITFRNLIRFYKHLTGAAVENPEMVGLSPRAEWVKAAAPPRRLPPKQSAARSSTKKISLSQNKCGGGKEINIKTGRCIKKCVAKTERNPKTGRCIKKCATVRNPKTGRCVATATRKIKLGPPK